MTGTTSPVGLRTFAITAALVAAGCTVDASQPQDEGEVAVTSQALMYGSHAYTIYLKDRSLTSQDTHFLYTVNDAIPTWSSAGTGRVTVHFVDLPGSFGNAQVTAIGSDDVRCKVEGWRVSSGDRLVDVLCHNSDGVLANSDFVVYYHTAIAGSIGGAYLLNNNPTSALNIAYDAPSGYRYNEHGGTNRITRIGTGVYDNRLPGHGPSEGVAHVTAYGSGSEYCNVSSLSASGNDRIVRVRCYDTNGQPANAGYSLDYKTLGFQGPAGTGGSAVANNSTSTSYRPTTWYNSGACQPVLRDALATRSATGKYKMRFHSLSPPSLGILVSVGLVSGFSSGAGYCKIGRDAGDGAPWWATVGADQTDIEIPVRCWNDSGSLMNRQYVATYVTPWIAGDCNPMQMW